MFPVSGVESVFLPVTNNQTGNFYVMSGNAAGFSGLFVNNNVQPYPHEQQARAGYYPMVGVLTFPQGALNINSPYDLPVVRSPITPCSISGQDEPAMQIRYEVKDEIADQACRFASETQYVDSNMEDNVKSEKGFTNLRTNVSVECPGFGVRFPQDTLYENIPLAQHIDPSSIMSCTKSEQDMPSPQIKSEVKDGVANQACVYVYETPFVDSSLQDNVEREKYSNLESIEANRSFSQDLEQFTTMCSFCGRTFIDIDALQDHLPSHNDMNNMENKIITDGRQKYGQADQVRPFFCKMCPWKFKCASDLRIHLFVHSGKTPTCEVCKTKFQCHIALKKYMKVHEKIRTHKKKRWSKYDISSREENGSVSSEVERKVVICSFCDTAFSDIDALQEHLPTHNDLNDLENKVITEKKQQDGQADHFSCKMCPCKFLCATELRIHLFAHSGKTPTCEVCKRKFNFRNGLKKHMMVHKQVQTFKNNISIQEENRPIPSKNKLKEIPCSFCDTVFSEIDALQDHLPSHNEINNSGTRLIIERRKQQGHADKGHPVFCKICRCKFSTAIELRIHLFLHSGKIPTCEVCGRKFLLRKHLKGHMMIHEKVRNFKCKICEKEFFREYKLRQHINMIHLGRKLKCDTCNSVFSHPERLAEHKRWVHSSSDDMTCAKCDEQFNSLKDLSIHNLTHSKKSQFICLICNIVFARKRELTRHKSTSHRDKDKKVHQCSECYRKFKLLNNLIDHKKLHADDKTCPKFRCENCSKVFANDNRLRMHTTRCQEHAKLKLCHKCGQFCDNRSFSDHLNSHLDTGGYTCKACNEIFSNRKSFKIHVLRHKGITPPTCDRCGFECVNPSALKRHIDCHNGVKAFECKECGKKYSSVTSLNEHMVKHTGIRPYQCKLCLRSFPCRKNKVRHEKLHAKGFQRIRK